MGKFKAYSKDWAVKELPKKLSAGRREKTA